MNIVITGVTRGLGRALAEWYIANGHTVAGCGRSGPAIFDLRFTHPEPHSFRRGRRDAARSRSTSGPSGSWAPWGRPTS